DQPRRVACWRSTAEEPDHRHPRLLRPRRERPRCRRAAEQRDKFAPPDHSITSSARASSVGGTSRPSAFAWLLRAHRKWPGHRRTAEQRDELAPFDHSITSSARASSVGGTSRPSAFAAWRLMTSSNLLDCTTGRSAGLVPFKMRAAYVPT